MKEVKTGYLIGVIFLVLGCFSFAEIRSKRHKISDIEIEFRGEGARFLSVEIVNKLLIQSQDSLFFQQKDMVALNEIELQLLDHPMIKTAELYTVPQGKLYVEIDERRPVVRVQGERSFYVDQFGVEMPLSARHSARVPLYYGELDKDKKQQMVHLLSSLTTDAFIKEELVDLQWSTNGFVLGLRSYPFQVLWGNNDRFSAKVEKLKRFCAYAKSQKEKKYNWIDLSFAKQVVAR